MGPHVEIESTRSVALATAERIWSWEIPVYLFLGGIVAGIMMAVSAAVLLGGRERVTRGMRTGLLLAPVLLSLGMGALFLDISYKLHVFRFYTTLQITAPMSLGSWILLLVYPVQILLILAVPDERLVPLLGRVKALGALRRWAERQARRLALAGLVLGVGLGAYTGLLLATTVAHPLWSSGALGFLFLVSGASTGVAALMMLEGEHAVQNVLARTDLALIGIELLAMVLWLAGLSTQGPLYRAAASQVITGPYAPAFLGMVVFGGLVVPFVLEVLSLRGKTLHSRWVPALVIVGGLLLRFVIVYAGQDVGFVTG
jgi:protein NrfD